MRHLFGTQLFVEPREPLPFFPAERTPEGALGKVGQCRQVTRPTGRQLLGELFRPAANRLARGPFDVVVRLLAVLRNESHEGFVVLEFDQRLLAHVAQLQPEPIEPLPLGVAQEQPTQRFVFAEVHPQADDLVVGNDLAKKQVDRKTATKNVALRRQGLGPQLAQVGAGHRRQRMRRPLPRIRRAGKHLELRHRADAVRVQQALDDEFAILEQFSRQMHFDNRGHRNDQAVCVDRLALRMRAEAGEVCRRKNGACPAADGPAAWAISLSIRGGCWPPSIRGRCQVASPPCLPLRERVTK